MGKYINPNNSRVTSICQAIRGFGVGGEDMRRRGEREEEGEEGEMRARFYPASCIFTPNCCLDRHI
jgi:hypothetical protein